MDPPVQPTLQGCRAAIRLSISATDDLDFHPNNGRLGPIGVQIKSKLLASKWTARSAALQPLQCRLGYTVGVQARLHCRISPSDLGVCSYFSFLISLVEIKT